MFKKSGLVTFGLIIIQEIQSMLKILNIKCQGRWICAIPKVWKETQNQNMYSYFKLALGGSLFPTYLPTIFYESLYINCTMYSSSPNSYVPLFLAALIYAFCVDQITPSPFYRPLAHFPCRACHSAVLSVHLLSFSLAICSAHLQFLGESKVYYNLDLDWPGAMKATYL